jgi:hypothetical protein
MPEEKSHQSTEGHEDPKFAPKHQQPEGSQVDGYAPKYDEPEDASVTEPESSSGAGVGSAEWECLTCGSVFKEDIGRCTKDGAPLRKTGAHAAPVAGKLSTSENIERPASRPDQTPEGYNPKPATAREEAEGGTTLPGER